MVKKNQNRGRGNHELKTVKKKQGTQGRRQKPPKENLADKSSTHTTTVAHSGLTTPSKGPPNAESNSEMTGAVDSLVTSIERDTVEVSSGIRIRVSAAAENSGSKENKEPVSIKETSGPIAINQDAPEEETKTTELIPAETCESGDNGNSQWNGKKGSQPVLQYKRKKRVSKGISLPFEKRSQQWAKYESDEFYQKSSQKPHFSPLKDVRMKLREGLALAQMVKFIKVVTMLRNFKLSDPAHIILEHLKIVDALQCHGFDVRAINARLKELQDWKVKIGQLEEKVKKIEYEKHNIEEPDIEAHIKELQENLYERERAKKIKDTEIITLKSNLHWVNHKILEGQLAFQILDKPHFSPLKGFEEDERESLAPFYMDMFLDVVRRISEFELTNPMEILADALEKVVELPRHGFDVSAITAHLEELREFKAKMGKLEERRDKINQDLEKAHMEMLVVDREIKELQEKLDESVRAKKNNDTEIKRLESHWNLVMHQILTGRLDFDNLVARPL